MTHWYTNLLPLASIDEVLVEFQERGMPIKHCDTCLKTDMKTVNVSLDNTALLLSLGSTKLVS